MTALTRLQVLINRNRWLRGTRDGALRNRDSGHECAVGSIARAAGIPARRLEGRSRISVLEEQQLPAMLHEFDKNRNDATWVKDPRAPERRIPSAYLLYSINDDPLLGGAARERMLTATAATIAIELQFCNVCLPPHAIAPTTDGRARQGAISRGERTDRPPRRVEIATAILTREREWKPLDKTRLTLDSDPESTWAYTYDLLRSMAFEHDSPVRITVRDTTTGRTIGDAYHEPVR